MPATWHSHGIGPHPDKLKGGKSVFRDCQPFNPAALKGAGLSRPTTVDELRAKAGRPPIARQ